MKAEGESDPLAIGWSDPFVRAEFHPLKTHPFARYTVGLDEAASPRDGGSGPGRFSMLRGVDILTVRVWYS
jgi:hypothetical protein